MPTDMDLCLDVSGACGPVPLIQLAKSVRNLKPGRTRLITGNKPISSLLCADVSAPLTTAKKLFHGQAF